MLSQSAFASSDVDIEGRLQIENNLFVRLFSK